MNYVVIALSVAVLAAMAWFAVREFGGSTRAQQQQAEEAVLAAIGVSLGDQPLTPSSIGGTVETKNGETEFNAAVDAVLSVLSFDRYETVLKFTTEPVSAAVTLTDTDGAAAFSGTAEEFAAYRPENGDYSLTVTAEYSLQTESGDAVKATVEYSAQLSYAVELKFYLSADTVSQGDVLLFCADGLDDTAALSVTLPFAHTPYFYRTSKGCYAYIPFNYMRAEGEYTVTAVYEGEEMTFTYSVTEPEYEVQHLTVSSSTASSTIGDNSAVSTYNAVMAELGAIADSDIYWDERFIQPVDGTITTEFGIKRYTNGASVPSRHAGIDIAAAEGTPVAASNSGRVVYADYLQVSGNTVVIEHGMGLKTFYLHMDEINCAKGDMVSRGDIIGKVGMTGFSTGPHLHFQAQVGEMCISPWYLFDGTSGVYGLAD